MNDTSLIIKLKKGKEHSLLRKHPWIFSGAIQQYSPDLSNGCWVKILSADDQTLGFGHYQKGSITVRMLAFGDSIPDQNFYINKIQAALDLRHGASVISPKTNAWRLIHGEGDGLPGLIVDVYNGAAIVQAHSYGMHLDRHSIATAILSVLGKKVHSVYYKSQGTLDHADNEYLHGNTAVPHTVLEHGSKFLVDWESGQKTGFFLDQRENRKLMGELAKGRTVLNTFCYTAGFSVYALHGKAKSVHSVDASEKAIALAKLNIELNGFNTEENPCVVADTFEFLKNKADVYDLIILDPPAFAKHKDARHQAMKGYQRLNAEAIRAIKPGGIIFTFSCSQVVDKQLFYDTVVSSAIQAGRNIKVLQLLGQPADHPVSIYHPEGEYLKGLVLYVE